MQVLQIDKHIIPESKTDSEISKIQSKITWRDIQGLSWIFEDELLFQKL